MWSTGCTLVASVWIDHSGFALVPYQNGPLERRHRINLYIHVHRSSFQRMIPPTGVLLLDFLKTSVPIKNISQRSVHNLFILVAAQHCHRGYTVQILCTFFSFPFQFSPSVTKGNDAHVHHLLVYLCDSLNETHVGNGGSCRDGVANEVAECRSGVLIAAWAVGGEVRYYLPRNT